MKQKEDGCKLPTIYQRVWKNDLAFVLQVSIQLQKHISQKDRNIGIGAFKYVLWGPFRLGRNRVCVHFAICENCIEKIDNNCHQGGQTLILEGQGEGGA